ncbi:hypothetical protein [Paenibacillus sp. GCM10012306]|uniref:hypothetical protein n=1 Tax=Paenibacillus sp. GCM10012306 TaxID=3317342 RepID=UPI003614CEE2
MTQKNIQMKYNNGSDWDELFPKTKSTLVTLNSGKTIEDHVMDTISHITAAERLSWNAKVTQADIDSAIKKLVGAAPAVLDTLEEIAIALGKDPNFAATIATQLASKVDKVAGKDLSANDFTNTLKTKLDGITDGATKVQSSTNGKIKINGADVDVYIHPIGTNPHGTTKADVGLGNVENKSSATIRAELSTTDVNAALGFIPTKTTSGNDASKPTATGSKAMYIAVDTGKIYLDNASGTWLLVGGGGTVNWSSLTGTPVTLAGYGITDATPLSHVGTGGATHATVTTTTAGFMSAADKTKLDGIATSANNYVHPSGDGNLHVPATGTSSNAKVLKSGATAGSAAWGNVDYSEVTGKPTTFAPSAHTHNATDVVESSTKRFTTDAEKSIWGGKSKVTVGTVSPTDADVWFQEV